LPDFVCTIVSHSQGQFRKFNNFGRLMTATAQCWSIRSSGTLESRATTRVPCHLKICRCVLNTAAMYFVYSYFRKRDSSLKVRQ